MWRLSSFVICLTLYLSISTGTRQQRSHASQIRGQRMYRQGNETTEEPPRNCMCSKIYDPVCASNGKSYYNLCQMECENKPGTVYVVHQGNCIPF